MWLVAVCIIQLSKNWAIFVHQSIGLIGFLLLARDCLVGLEDQKYSKFAAPLLALHQWFSNIVQCVFKPPGHLECSITCAFLCWANLALLEASCQCSSTKLPTACPIYTVISNRAKRPNAANIALHNVQMQQVVL